MSMNVGRRLRTHFDQNENTATRNARTQGRTLIFTIENRCSLGQLASQASWPSGMPLGLQNHCLGFRARVIGMLDLDMILASLLTFHHICQYVKRCLASAFHRCGRAGAPILASKHCAVGGAHPRFEHFGVCCCRRRLGRHFELCRKVHSLCSHKRSLQGSASRHIGKLAEAREQG